MRKRKRSLETGSKAILFTGSVRGKADTPGQMGATMMVNIKIICGMAMVF